MPKSMFQQNKEYFVLHYFTIKVLDKSRNSVEFLKWANLRFELRVKYDWYFKYRAALLQIKYPKHTVQTHWGSEPALGKFLENLKRNKIIAKKRKITEFENKLKLAEKNWNSLFPIHEDIFYQKATAKIERLKKELVLLTL
ncbi:MAG TPA: hypothetical protein PKW61_00030 [Tenuifilaceae bacterium]|nr:hypothetical protein [Tenuifilaceae bacterium]